MIFTNSSTEMFAIWIISISNYL